MLDRGALEASHGLFRTALFVKPGASVQQRHQRVGAIARLDGAGVVEVGCGLFELTRAAQRLREVDQHGGIGGALRERRAQRHDGIVVARLQQQHRAQVVQRLRLLRRGRQHGAQHTF